MTDTYAHTDRERERHSRERQAYKDIQGGGGCQRKRGTYNEKERHKTARERERGDKRRKSGRQGRKREEDKERDKGGDKMKGRQLKLRLQRLSSNKISSKACKQQAFRKENKPTNEQNS